MNVTLRVFEVILKADTGVEVIQSEPKFGVLRALFYTYCLITFTFVFYRQAECEIPSLP